jgi:hypothetical protein
MYLLLPSTSGGHQLHPQIEDMPCLRDRDPRNFHNKLNVSWTDGILLIHKNLRLSPCTAVLKVRISFSLVPSLYIVTMVTSVMLTLSSHCYRNYVALLLSLATNSCVWHLDLLIFDVKTLSAVQTWCFRGVPGCLKSKCTDFLFNYLLDVPEITSYLLQNMSLGKLHGGSCLSSTDHSSPWSHFL